MHLCPTRKTRKSWTGSSKIPHRELIEQKVEARLEEEVVAQVEAFAPIVENAFLLTGKEPQSTFSIDVDTASYVMVRRLPEPGVAAAARCRSH